MISNPIRIETNYIVGGDKKENISIHPAPKLTDKQLQHIQDIIREVEEQWTNRHGFILLKPSTAKENRPDNENPVLFTAEYLYLLWRLRVLKGELRQNYKNKIIGMIAKLQLEPGLFNRYPGREAESFERHFSRDEQIGLVTLDYIFNGELGYARDLYEYGMRHNFCYQNRTWSAPGEHKRAAQGKHNSIIELWATGLRQPAFIEYLRMACDEKLDLQRQEDFRGLLTLTKQRHYRDTSSKILAFLRCEVMYGKDNKSTQAIDDFFRWMRIVYGENPLQQIYAIYFKHPQHPFHRLAKLLHAGLNQEQLAPPKFHDIQETVVSLPIQLPLSKLRTLVNKEITKKMNKHFVVEHGTHQVRIAFARIGCEKKVDLQLNLTRTAAVQVQGTGAKLRLSMPISFTARVDGLLRGGKINIKKHIDIAGSLHAVLDAQITFNSQWELQFTLQIRYSWTQKPKAKILDLKFYEVEIRMGGFIDKLLQAQIGKWTTKLKHEVENSLSLRQRVLKLWGKLQQPLKLPVKQGDVWLQVVMKRAHLLPLRFENDSLFTHITLGATLKLYLASQKPAAQKFALPPLQKTPYAGNTSLYIPVHVSFHELGKVIHQQLQQQLIDNKDFAIETIHVYSVDGLLLFKIKAKLREMPDSIQLIVGIRLEMDKQQLVTVSEMSLHPSVDIASRDLTAAIAIFLRDKIPMHMHFPLAELLTALCTPLNRKLQKFDIEEVAQIKGEAQTLAIKDLIINNGGISFVVHCSGSLAVENF